MKGPVLCRGIKRSRQNITYDLKGLFFWRGIQRSLHNQTYNLKGLFFWRDQTDSISVTTMQTSGVYPTHVQLGWVSALMSMNAVIGISLRQSKFSSSVYPTKQIWYTCPKAGFTSNPNDFTPESKHFTPDSKNPFRHPGLGLINSLSFRAINI